METLLKADADCETAYEQQEARNLKLSGTVITDVFAREPAIPASSDLKLHDSQHAAPLDKMAEKGKTTDSWAAGEKKRSKVQQTNKGEKTLEKKSLKNKTGMQNTFKTQKNKQPRSNSTCRT